MRDLRDPAKLGLALEGLATGHDARLRFIYDKYRMNLDRVPDYDHDPGPLERYGDPRKIPSTMPNAVE